MTPTELGLWADLLKGAGAGGLLIVFLVYLVLNRQKKDDERWQEMHDSQKETNRSLDDMSLSINTLLIGMAGVPQEAKEVAKQISEHIKERMARNRKES